MTEKSHCPQAGRDDWDRVMKQVVQIYAEETISAEQVSRLSERICAKIKSGELIERRFTSTAGGARENALRRGDCS